MPAVKRLEIYTMMGFLSKTFKDLDKKVQNSYLSYHWRVCKVWKKNYSWFQKWHEEFGEF